jgi:hypothetical protein
VREQPLVKAAALVNFINRNYKMKVGVRIGNIIIVATINPNISVYVFI